MTGMIDSSYIKGAGHSGSGLAVTRHDVRPLFIAPPQAFASQLRGPSAPLFRRTTPTIPHLHCTWPRTSATGLSPISPFHEGWGVTKASKNTREGPGAVAHLGSPCCIRTMHRILRTFNSKIHAWGVKPGTGLLPGLHATQPLSPVVWGGAATPDATVGLPQS